MAEHNWLWANLLTPGKAVEVVPGGEIGYLLSGHAQAIRGRSSSVPDSMMVLKAGIRSLPERLYCWLIPVHCVCSCTRDPVGTGQRYPGHGGGFKSERYHVFRLEIEHMALATGPGQRLDLQGQSCEVVAQ